jgi:hypothetical protein
VDLSIPTGPRREELMLMIDPERHLRVIREESNFGIG